MPKPLPFARGFKSRVQKHQGLAETILAKGDKMSRLEFGLLWRLASGYKEAYHMLNDAHRTHINQADKTRTKMWLYFWKNYDKYRESDQKFVTQYKDSEEFTKYKSVVSGTLFKGAQRLRLNMAQFTPETQIPSELQVLWVSVFPGSYTQYMYRVSRGYLAYQLSKKAVRKWLKWSRSAKSRDTYSPDLLKEMLEALIEAKHPFIA